MTREHLYFAIRREPYANGSFDVMRVTKVTPRRVYGSINGIGTHALPNAVFGQFPTEEKAREALKPVTEAHRSFNNRIRDAQSAVARAYADQRDAVESALQKALNDAN